MDTEALLRSLDEIKRLSRDPLAADRIAHIIDRLRADLEREMARSRADEESGDGPGLVQPPRDN